MQTEANTKNNEITSIRGVIVKYIWSYILPAASHFSHNLRNFNDLFFFSSFFKIVTVFLICFDIYGCDTSHVKDLYFYWVTHFLMMIYILVFLLYSITTITYKCYKLYLFKKMKLKNELNIKLYSSWVS
jgi:hypothetical protein